MGLPKTVPHAKKAEAREYQTLHSGVFFEIEKTLYKGKSRFQEIGIILNKDYGKVLLLDGLVQTTERDEFYYHEMLVQPAMSSHRRPADVLVIGGGDGGALREVLKHPVRKVWMVEIDAEVVEACKTHFGWIRVPLRDRRVELVIADGNEFVGRAGERFDVIIVDSSDPVGPSTILHQEAFYRRLKSRLKPGGIVAGQAGSLLLHLDAHARKAAFLKKLFRFSRIYLGPVPTYPVGTWCYDFLSDDVDPQAGRRLRIPAGLRFFNSDVFAAAFAQPNFLKEALKTAGKRRPKS